MMVLQLYLRHCERSEAIHRTSYVEAWIASSLWLLAMTGLHELRSILPDGIREAAELPT
jgi:hypothetical protein